MMTRRSTTHRSIAITAAALMLVSSAHALSEGSTMTSMTESAADEAAIQQIASQLTGTWETTSPIETSDDGSEVDMVLSIAPVAIEGLDNTLYVESVRSDTPWTPFRQAIYQIYMYKDTPRLRTYTMAMNDVTLRLFNGFTAAPEHFPAISKDQLIATLDLDIDSDDSSFEGSTPYPYPTGVMGAVEMTSLITCDGTTLTTSDRGYDAEGNVVWGADENDAYKFERVDPYARVLPRDDALIVIEYPSSVSDEVVAEGDEMHVHYSGFLTDGTMFDSSYLRGEPFIFRYPPGTRAIVGWGLGMDGMSLGAHRKLIIPSDLGYGPGGNPRASIPGDSTLVFNIYLPHIERFVPAPETDADDGAESPSDPDIKAGVSQD